MHKLIRIIIFVYLSIFIWGCSGGFKSARKKMEAGKYNTAIPILENIVKSSPKPHVKAKAQYLIGEAYRLSNRVNRSLPYYNLALEGGHYRADNLEFYYAYALKANGMYAEAKEQFEKYTKTGADYEYLRRAKDEIDNLAMVAELSEPNPYIKLENCAAINTSGAEYGPVLWQKDKIVFTTNQNADEIYEATGTGYTDLHVYTFDAENPCAGESKPFSQTINLPGFHEATPTFSADGKLMIFARSNSRNKKDPYREVNLYESRLVNGKWTEPEMLPSPVNHQDHWDGAPALSPDGNTLYFASSRPSGYGGLDIYRASRTSDGRWIRVVNMGSSINTRGNEMFPYVAVDRRLYYASDGLPGLGGLDIFIASREGGEISVKNMGAPYNSSRDDFGLIYIENKKGFFSSNRDEDLAKGDDDIYFFADETPKFKEVRYFLAGKSYQGTNINREILPNAEIRLLNKQGELLATTTSDDQGDFQFEEPIEIGPTYTVIGNKTEYLPHQISYPTEGLQVDQTTIMDLPEDTVSQVLTTEVTLQQDIFIGLEEGKEIELEGITYEFDKWDITEEAKEQLNRLVDYMRSNNEVRVQLGSHTDSRGASRYNMRLSQRRSESAVDYIVSQGIDQERIVAKAYGQTELKIPNAQTEEEHRQNRRTTVQLLDEL